MTTNAFKALNYSMYKLFGLGATVASGGEMSALSLSLG